MLTIKSVFYMYLFSFTPTSPKKETIIVLILPEGNVVALSEFFNPDFDVKYLEWEAL